MRATTSSVCSPTAPRVASEVSSKSIGDGIAMEADRLDGLFAARGDTCDDLVDVFCDGAACRRRKPGTSRLATVSPWKRIASAACSPLALTRATTSSDVFRDGAACRRGSLGQPIGDGVAMEADRLGGLFAARADASDDLVRVFGDGAAGRGGGLGQPLDDRVRHGNGSPRRPQRRLRRRARRDRPRTRPRRRASPPRPRRVGRRPDPPGRGSPRQSQRRSCSPGRRLRRYRRRPRCAPPRRPRRAGRRPTRPGSGSPRRFAPRSR